MNGFTVFATRTIKRTSVQRRDLLQYILRGVAPDTLCFYAAKTGPLSVCKRYAAFVV